MKRIGNIWRSQSGIALITVILIISILVAAALELNRSSRADVYDAANLSDGVRLSYIAKSGFYGAVAVISNSKNDYETLRDDWAHAELISAQSKALFPNGYFVVRIEDEKGKIPINKLVANGAVNENIKAVLLRLLLLPEFELDEAEAAAIVDSIIDWIDENEEVTGHGAESSYYLSQGLPYGAKNAALDCIEELLMVKGITEELFSGTGKKPGLVQFVTIYSDEAAVHINTAPTLVLRALSDEITIDLADKMDAYRKASGHDLSSVDWYKKVTGMENITIKPELIDMVKSKYFKIYATGVSDKMERHITGVLYRPAASGESPSIVNWRMN